MQNNEKNYEAAESEETKKKQNSMTKNNLVRSHSFMMSNKKVYISDPQHPLLLYP